MLEAKPHGSDFGFMKFNPDGQSLIYYFDDDTLKEKALKDNAYKLKYSIATNNITFFGSNLGDWKFSSKIMDLSPPIHYISTYSTKFYKLTFECLRYSEPNRKEFMKELLVSIIQFIIGKHVVHSDCTNDNLRFRLHFIQEERRSNSRLSITKCIL